MTLPEILIGIDIGGTFTDAIVFDRRTRQVLLAFKTPSTPTDPATAVITALERIAGEMSIQGARVCHGTTIGTNALIERRGARTGLLATEGFTDIIELRRQDRPNLYDLAVELSEPLVAPADRFGVFERVDAEGNVVAPLQGVDALLDRVAASGVQSLAVALLHSYASPAHEQAIKRRLAERLPGMYVTLSSEISPEYGEYERTSTTVVNSYIGPPVKEYLERLERDATALGVSQVLIVKSNGGLTSAHNAMQFPAHLIESGPAAGTIASAAYAANIERQNVIAFDMGGTTAKAGVITGYSPEMVYEFRADALKHGKNVGGYPIRSAVLDIVEIGSGGGSIAWIDAGGVPKVGPESAGADPGPACYSRGGTRPTVTDAHAVIGTLSASTFAGTGVAFDRSLAVRAIEDHIARPQGWTVERAAYAIIQIAVANMNEMVKLATVRRGLDPRDFSIVASGGAGPLHAALVGAEIGARETVVPPYPGMFSALGATLGRVKHDLSMSLVKPLAQLTADAIAQAFQALAGRADAVLAAEHTQGLVVVLQRKAFCRFSGQLYELELPLGNAQEPLPTPQALEQQYRDAYRREFGFELPRAAVEIVKVHLGVELIEAGVERVFQPSTHTAGSPAPLRLQRYITPEGEDSEIPVYSSAASIGLAARGPMLIEHAGSTVWVRDADEVRICSDGAVLVRHIS
jgi:N-methylhydantoinase A